MKEKLITDNVTETQYRPIPIADLIIGAALIVFDNSTLLIIVHNGSCILGDCLLYFLCMYTVHAQLFHVNAINSLTLAWHLWT